MPRLPASIRFRFRYLDSRGRPAGFISKRGWFDGETLTLDRTQLPVIVIARAVTRLDRLVLMLFQSDGSIKPAAMVVYRGAIKTLLPALVKSISARHAEIRKEHLATTGKADLFHSEICPYCSATIDLSGRKPTPQAYCPFCDSIVTLEGERPPDEAKYHLCDHCGLYSQPRGFTILYFYFLVAVVGGYQKRVHRCDTCMRPDAWKMLAGNLPFLLGVPVAVTQLCRVYFGGSRFSKAFTGLDSANALAKRGKHERAIQEYQTIEDRLLCCAGVRYNHGLALKKAGRLEDAATAFEEALEDCSNYGPAYERLCECLESLNRGEALESLRSQWRLASENDQADSHLVVAPEESPTIAVGGF